jgi:hypothetical protein
MAALLGLSLFGCGPTPPTLDYDEGEFVGYKVHYEFQTEQWNDPDILSTPRLQFVWRHPEQTDNPKRGIWSMRLDGSDLRQVASRELLDQPTPGATRNERLPVRSPNNRYIALSMVSACNTCAVVRIVDLATQTVKELDTELYDGGQYFQWSADSRYLVFSGRGIILEHDMHTDTTKSIVKRFSKDGDPGDFRLIEGGKKIYFERDKQRYVHDYHTGEFLYALKRRAHGSPMSADEKYYITDMKKDPVLGSELGISTFENPYEPVAYLHKEMGWRGAVTLGNMHAVFQASRNDIKMAYPGENKITRYELPMGEGEAVYSFINNLSLYNTANFVNQ